MVLFQKLWPVVVFVLTSSIEIKIRLFTRYFFCRSASCDDRRDVCMVKVIVVRGRKSLCRGLGTNAARVMVVRLILKWYYWLELVNITVLLNRQTRTVVCWADYTVGLCEYAEVPSAELCDIPLALWRALTLLCWSLVRVLHSWGDHILDLGVNGLLDLGFLNEFLLWLPWFRLIPDDLRSYSLSELVWFTFLGTELVGLFDREIDNSSCDATAL